MKEQFETTLSSPDEAVDGIARPVSNDGRAWEFKSIDGSVHLIISRDENDDWRRISGSEPFLTSWVEELGQKIEKHQD